MRQVSSIAALALLAGCARAGPPAQCPDLAATVPPSIGAPFVTGLGSRLAGPDRENVIAGAIAEIRRRDPSIGTDGIVDILIAADCPNVLARPEQDINADRDRIAAFRAQVEQGPGTGNGQ
jgi:hypothetical protein